MKNKFDGIHEGTCPDMGIIFKALEFAACKHSGQKRKDEGETPYITHPIALANLLCNEGGITEKDVLCAALLHDTIEDTETTYVELFALLGKTIADIVQEVTDDKTLPKSERKRLQIEHASHASTPAKLIKLADKISNLRDIVNCPPLDWDSKRKQEYFDWAKKVVDEIRGTNEVLENSFDELYAKGIKLH